MKGFSRRPTNTKDLRTLLSRGDLRTIGDSNDVIAAVKTKEDFEALFKLIFSNSRPVAMRASDAVEKVSKEHPEYLSDHADQIVELAKTVSNKEMKWHLAQLLPRLSVSPEKMRRLFQRLNYWASNPNESRIVRVNSLQGMYELSLRLQDAKVNAVLQNTIRSFEGQRLPSLSARARKLRLQLEGSSVRKK